MPGEELIGLVSVGMVFGIPMLAIWTSHRRKMLELQIQLKGQNSNVSSNSIESLREEIRALRDTSTQYDVSFDNALQRIEQRVGSLERRANTQDAANPPNPIAQNFNLRP